MSASDGNDGSVFTRTRPSPGEIVIGLDTIAGDGKEKAKWLLGRIQESIDRVRLRSNTNQRKAARIKLSIVLLSTATAVILGLDIGGIEKWLKYAAFVCSLVATFLGVLEPYFNYRGLWVQHERAEYLFLLLKDDLQFYLSGYDSVEIPPKDILYFHNRFQQIWIEISEDWLDQRVGERYSI